MTAHTRRPGAAPELPVGRIGILAAIYPAVCGVGQLITGALSDRLGRKWLIRRRDVAAGDRPRPESHHPWLRPLGFQRGLLGAGTAMV